MRLLQNNFLGRCFPFFLHNDYENKSYYVYQFYSPGLSPNFFPWISLKKICEKTIPEGSEPNRYDTDVLARAMNIQGSKVKIFPEKGLRWLRNTYRNFPAEVQFEGNKFPKFEMDPYSQSVQRNLIMALRDAIRWNYYKIEDGKMIDLLWDRDTFMTLKVNVKKGKVTLEPVALYNIMDVEMKKPLPLPTNIDIKKIHPNLFQEFKLNEKGGMSNLFRNLKEFEWESFDRKNNLPLSLRREMKRTQKENVAEEENLEEEEIIED